MAFYFDEDAEAGEVVGGEGGEGFEEGETVGGGGDEDGVGRVGHAGCGHEGGVSLGEASRGEGDAFGRGEAEGVAGGGGEGVGDGVEGCEAGVGHGGDEFGGGEKVHGRGVTVVAAFEVAVVGREDCVGGAAGDAVGAFPLADAGAAGVG